MKSASIQTMLLICATMMVMEITQAAAKTKPVKIEQQRVTCYNRGSRCFMKHIKCPLECPQVRPKDFNAKSCFLDCYSPKCEAVCRKRKPNCDGPGAACFDPRFIGGDGIVFYFHGKSNEHFSLISDVNLQINARFIGLRPEGRTRDFTWIQGLGIMFNSHNFTLEATKAEKWDQKIDHLQFSFDGQAVSVPEGHSSEWSTSVDHNDNDLIKVERTSTTNSVTVTIPELVEISANVVPVSAEDNAIHNYQMPPNDSFAHLEVQFRFFSLSPKVDGVLGRTYQPDFKNPAKPGVAMPVVGGDDKYRTGSLLSADCKSCVFNPGPGENAADSNILMNDEHGILNCTGGVGTGSGIVCKK